MHAGLIMNQKYEIVEKLKDKIRELDLSIAKSPTELLDAGHYFHRVEFTFKDTVIHFPFMDEYDDIKLDNPVVYLNFILQECETFEEAVNYDEWCKDAGIMGADQKSKDLYSELAQKVPHIRSIVGFDLEAINDFDIQLNTGVTQALRAATL